MALFSNVIVALLVICVFAIASYAKADSGHRSPGSSSSEEMQPYPRRTSTAEKLLALNGKVTKLQGLVALAPLINGYVSSNASDPAPAVFIGKLKKAVMNKKLQALKSAKGYSSESVESSSESSEERSGRGPLVASPLKLNIIKLLAQTATPSYDSSSTSKSLVSSTRKPRSDGADDEPQKDAYSTTPQPPPPTIKLLEATLPDTQYGTTKAAQAGQVRRIKKVYTVFNEDGQDDAMEDAGGFEYKLQSGPYKSYSVSRNKAPYDLTIVRRPVVVSETGGIENFSGPLPYQLG